MWQEKKKINLIHVKYNFAIDNHFPLINNSKNFYGICFCCQPIKISCCIEFRHDEGNKTLTYINFCHDEGKKMLPCIEFCDDERKKTLTYIISKTDHLEKIGWGGTLILLHPRTPHKFWRLDRSVQIELQQRHLSGNLNRMKLKQTNKMHQFKVNFLHRQLFLTRISHETLL